MTEIVFATTNAGKVKEATAFLAEYGIKVIPLSEVKTDVDLGEAEETHETFIENAIEKAQYYSKKLGLPVLAEDDGIEIYALNMAPGVYTARYAESADTTMSSPDYIIHKMEGIEDRRARFVSGMVICNGNEVLATSTGVCEGAIPNKRATTNLTGMVFDSVFMPSGYNKTYAEMPDTKVAVSHRFRALIRIVDSIRNIEL